MSSESTLISVLQVVFWLIPCWHWFSHCNSKHLRIVSQLTEWSWRKSPKFMMYNYHIVNTAQTAYFTLGILDSYASTTCILICCCIQSMNRRCMIYLQWYLTHSMNVLKQSFVCRMDRYITSRVPLKCFCSFLKLDSFPCTTSALQYFWVLTSALLGKRLQQKQKAEVPKIETERSSSSTTCIQGLH